MSAIVVIGLPEDEGRVRNVVGAMVEEDLDIFWERTTPDQATWSRAVQQALDAKGLLFFWSASTQLPSSEAYRILVRRALTAGKAICVRLDDAPLAEGLEHCTTYDLRGWRARASSLFMLDLVAAVKAKAAGLDPPLPRAPRQLFLKRLFIVIPAIVAFLLAALSFYRDSGLDRIPSSAEAQAWAHIRSGSCEDLRTFLRAHSSGVHAAEAQALLSSRSIRSETVWRRAQRVLPLFIAGAASAPGSTEAAARQAADARASSYAQQTCRGLAQAGGSRLRSTEVRGAQLECERFSTGYSCSLRGEAVCGLEESAVVQSESCPRS